MAGRPKPEVRGAMPGDPAWAPDMGAYRASYPGTVKDQDETGLHIVCDSAIVGDDLRSVPALVAIPGCMITVPEDTRIRVAFENGDPRGAVAIGIDLDANATAALALVGDAIMGGSFSAVGVAVGAPIQFIYTPYQGAPAAPGPTVTIAGKVTGPGHAYAKGVSG